MNDNYLSNQEMLWRQYNLQIELYKYYLDLAIKANSFFYLITGGILSFYFANASFPLIKYSLLLPVLMSVAFGGIFLYGSFLVGVVRSEIFTLRDQLGFDTAPDIYPLIISLRVFGVVFLIVALSIAVLILIG